MSRKKAREAVLIAVYQTDIAQAEPGEALKDSLDFLEQEQKAVFTAEDKAYAHQLLNEMVNKREQADEIISRYLKEWTLDRIAAMDRALLRLGTAEMLKKELAHAVIIDQAVELAKKYGDDKSAPFVNAVLDKVQVEIKS